MQSLRENPFRLLGLLSSSSSREIDSRSKKLRQYLEAGVEPNVTPDYYCPALGRKPMRRLPESIEQARGMLTLDQDKLSYALLWFVQMNEVTDPVALEALAQGDLAEAERIWRQQVYTSDGALRAITDRNSSAYHNLSVYLLCSAQSANIVSGVKLGLMALEQGSVLSFLQEKLGVNGLSLLDIELLYLNRLIEDISKRPRGGLSQLMDLLGHQEYTAKKALMKCYALEAVKTLEETIERSIHQSKTVAGAGLAEGEKLLREGGEMLQQIAVSLPKNDPKYERASNALAKGVKSCGEEYFEDCSEQDDFASQRLMELYRKAKELACSDFVRTELDKKIDKLEEWIREAPQRKEEAKVREQVKKLEELVGQMKLFDEDTIPNVCKFLDACEPLLTQIKEKLGKDSAVHKKYGTVVVSVALDSLIEIVNESQEVPDSWSLMPRYKQMVHIIKLKDILSDAWKITLRLEPFAMIDSFRNGRFKKNKVALQGLCKNLGVTTPSAISRPAPTTDRPRSSTRSVSVSHSYSTSESSKVEAKKPGIFAPIVKWIGSLLLLLWDVFAALIVRLLGFVIIALIVMVCAWIYDLIFG